MVRDNANDFNSNADSTPDRGLPAQLLSRGIFQGRSPLRPRPTRVEGRRRVRQYLPARKFQLHHHRSRPSSMTARRSLSPSPRSGPTSSSRPSSQDLIHSGQLDHQCRASLGSLPASCEPAGRRAALCRFRAISLPPDSVLHFSYDRVFQTPSFENILLSSSTPVESLDPAIFCACRFSLRRETTTKAG